MKKHYYKLQRDHQVIQYAHYIQYIKYQSHTKKLNRIQNVHCTYNPSFYILERSEFTKTSLLVSDK